MAIIDYYNFYVFYATRKMIQMFSVFSVLCTNQKKLIYCKFVSESVALVFSEDIKMWLIIMLWIGKPVTGLHIYNICVDSMGLYYTNGNSLLFWVHYSSQKISEWNCFSCFGFAIANQIKAAI